MLYGLVLRPHLAELSCSLASSELLASSFPFLHPPHLQPVGRYARQLSPNGTSPCRIRGPDATIPDHSAYPLLIAAQGHSALRVTSYTTANCCQRRITRRQLSRYQLPQLRSCCPQFPSPVPCTASPLRMSHVPLCCEIGGFGATESFDHARSTQSEAIHAPGLRRVVADDCGGCRANHRPLPSR